MPNRQMRRRTNYWFFCSSRIRWGGSVRQASEIAHFRGSCGLWIVASVSVEVFPLYGATDLLLGRANSGSSVFWQALVIRLSVERRGKR
jgi:hypothetical protein